MNALATSVAPPMPVLDIPVLETPRMLLRAPTVDDFPAEVAFYASDRSRGVGGPYPIETVWRKMCERLGQWVLRGYGLWSMQMKDTGAYAGRVGIFHPHDWPGPELGWAVMADAEGKGLAFEAAQIVRRHVYQTHGWTRLISVIDPDNARSIALAERLGCTREPDWEQPTEGMVTIWLHPQPEGQA
ncbi:MAG: GNAT family N-acetyltransferase [Pseudomonadota bacterium]